MSVSRREPINSADAERQAANRTAYLKVDPTASHEELLFSPKQIAQEAERIRRSEREYIFEGGSEGHPARIKEAMLSALPKEAPPVMLGKDSNAIEISWTPGGEFAAAFGETHVYRLKITLADPGDDKGHLTARMNLDPTAVITARERDAMLGVLNQDDLSAAEKFVILHRICLAANAYLRDDKARAGDNKMAISFNGTTQCVLEGIDASHEDLRGDRYSNLQIRGGRFTGAKLQAIEGENLFLTGCDIRGQSRVEIAIRSTNTKLISGIESCNLRGRNISGLNLDLRSSVFKNNIVSDCIFEDALGRSSISIELEGLADAFTAGKKDVRAQIIKLVQKNFEGMIYNDDTVFAADLAVNDKIQAMLRAASQGVEVRGEITNGELVSSLMNSSGLPFQAIESSLMGVTQRFFRVYLGGGRELMFCAGADDADDCELLFAKEMPEGIMQGGIYSATQILMMLAGDLPEKKRGGGDRQIVGSGGGPGPGPDSPPKPEGEGEPEMRVEFLAAEAEHPIDIEPIGNNRSNAQSVSTEEIIDAEFWEVPSKDLTQIGPDKSDEIRSGEEFSREIKANSSVTAKPAADVVTLESGERDTEDTPSAALSEEEIAVAEEMRKKRERFESDRQRIAERKAAEQADKEEEEPQAKAG